MKKKSNKKIKLEGNSLKNSLFRELTNEELKQIKGGTQSIKSSFEVQLNDVFIPDAFNN